MKQTMRLLWQKTETGEARLLRVYAETSEVIIPAFIPASNEPSGCACTSIRRLPRGSNTPQLSCVTSLMPRQLAAGYLTEKYPVTEVGAYCFSASEHLEGKQFSITELPAENAKRNIDVVHMIPKNKTEKFSKEEHISALRTAAGDNLVKLCLPDTVRIIHNAAFYNCRKLESLAIGAGTAEIGSDVFTNCNALKKLHIRCQNYKAESAKSILSRISTELEVYYYDCDETDDYYEEYNDEAWKRENLFASLLYPEYFETYDEIAPAHIFGRHIEGEGFRARQCFKDGQILFAEYDKIFQKAKAEETTITIGRMCMHRLLFPIELTEEVRESYESFLKEHEKETGTFFVKQKNKAALEYYFRNHLLSYAGIDMLISCATDRKWSEGVSSMLHWKQQFYNNIPKNSYDFELDFD